MTRNEAKEPTREERLWLELWEHWWEISDDDWPTQTRRLREISKLALKLVDVIEGVEEEARE